MFILAALITLSTVADSSAQYLGHNSIGIYAQPDPEFSTAQEWIDLTCEDFPAGTFTLYVVLRDPWNDTLDRAIQDVGGFEFRIGWPSDYFVTPVLHNSATNFLTAPDFLAGANVPVLGRNCVLITLNCGTFTTDHREFFITPVSNPTNQTIPGSIAITDANDNYSISEAFPASGSFQEPVFRVNDCSFEPPAMTWDIGITALGSVSNYAGVTPGATDGYDTGLDLPDADNTVTFLRPEWGQTTDEFSTDIRAEYDPLSELKSWPVRVNVPEQSGAAANIQVFFNPSFSQGSGIRLQLTEVPSGTVHDLWPTLQYNFTSWGGPRDFILTVGEMDESFLIDWTANTSLMADLDNRVGTHPDATDGYDPGLDIPEPSPPPSNYLVASVEHQGWVPGPRFSQELKGIYDPLEDIRTWPLLVETDQSGEVELIFQPTFSSADGVSLLLRDEQTHETYSLYPSLNYRFMTTPAVNYRFTLMVGGSPMPDLSPPFSNVDAGWSLLSPPLDPVPPGTVASVILNSVVDYSYVFAFDTQSNSYTMLDESDPLGLGDGVWLATGTGFTWNMTGERKEEPTIVTLDQGWNLTGYPLWFPGPVEGVRVRLNGAERNWNDALAANWISSFMDYSQALDDYVDTLSLSAWHGYWIAAAESGTELVYDWHNFMVLPARLSGPKELPLPPEKGWRCLLVMDDGSDKQRSVTVGVHQDASDGYDATYDRPRPPASPSGGSTITLIRPEWTEKPWLRTLSQDIVAPLAGRTVEWTVSIACDKPGPVDLSWQRMGWPVGLDFQLYIPGENRVAVRSMLQSDSVTLEVGNTPLEVVVRTPNELSEVGDVPFAGYNLAAHPNPFNPQTTIAFDLPRAGHVAIQVYDLRGRLVDRIDGGTMPIGAGQLVWRGQDRNGRSASSGIYFARLMLDGGPVGEVARMSLVR